MGKKQAKQKENQEKTKKKVEIEKKITKDSNKSKIKRTKSIIATIKESNFVTIKTKQTRKPDQQINKSQQKQKSVRNVKKQPIIKKQIKKAPVQQQKPARSNQQQVKDDQQKTQNQPINQSNQNQQSKKIIKRQSSFEGNKFNNKDKNLFINQEILNEKTHELDEFFNFKEKFLGKEGAFSNYKVLVGYLSTGNQYCGGFDLAAGNELKKRGFSYDLVQTIEELNDKMLNYDIVWILSYNNQFLQTNKKTLDIFVEQVGNFMKAKKSLFLWSDNEPLFNYTNLILKKYFDGMEMKGNYKGDKIISKSTDDFRSDRKGKFDPTHTIFYGVNNLHEGVTICHPENIHSDFRVIAYNSNDEPLVLVAEENENHGRIILDTGFTKLYECYWIQAGTHQYVSNSNVWLTGIPD